MLSAKLKPFFVNFEISNYYEDLETASSATEIVKKQEGNYFTSSIGYLSLIHI